LSLFPELKRRMAVVYNNFVFCQEKAFSCVHFGFGTCSSFVTEESAHEH
jgi:hypothetical protein